MDSIYMQSPQGEVREVEATASALTPLMVAGWRQVAGPVATTAPAASEEDKQHGQH